MTLLISGGISNATGTNTKEKIRQKRFHLEVVVIKLFLLSYLLCVFGVGNFYDLIFIQPFSVVDTK